jgi:hypothetical protein
MILSMTLIGLRFRDSQKKRIEALVETLYRKFDIKAESIYYPGDWK